MRVIREGLSSDLGHAATSLGWVSANASNAMEEERHRRPPTGGGPARSDVAGVVASISQDPDGVISLGRALGTRTAIEASVSKRMPASPRRSATSLDAEFPCARRAVPRRLQFRQIRRTYYVSSAAPASLNDKSPRLGPSSSGLQPPKISCGTRRISLHRIMTSSR